MMKYVLIAIFFPLTVAAAGLDLTSNSDKSPIEVTADNSIEWNRNNQTVTAITNAVAKKAGVTLSADKITAKYRDDKGKNAEIYQLNATNGVKIKTITEEATGDNITYYVDNGLMVLTGTPASITTPEEKITADDKMEYYQNELKAVLYKNVIITKGDKTIHTEKLTAYFKDVKGSLELTKATLEDGITIETPNEKLIGSRGEYDATSQIAQVFGNVEIHQGSNVLYGDSAESNLKTGISKLKAGKSKQVKGSIMPNSTKKKDN